MNPRSDIPAFPFFHPDEAGVYTEGMSLRDYFAAKFMQGWMASWSGANPNEEGLRLTAKTAYEMADAMLLAREAA